MLQGSRWSVSASSAGFLLRHCSFCRAAGGGFMGRPMACGCGTGRSSGRRTAMSRGMPRCFASVPSAYCGQPIRSPARRGFAVRSAGAGWPVRRSLSIVGSSHFAHGDSDRSANQRANGSPHHRPQNGTRCAAGDFSSVRLFLCRLLCSFCGHILTPRLSGRCAGAIRRGSTQPDRT